MRHLAEICGLAIHRAGFEISVRRTAQTQIEQLTFLAGFQKCWFIGAHVAHFWDEVFPGFPQRSVTQVYGCAWRHQRCTQPEGTIIPDREVSIAGPAVE